MVNECFSYISIMILERNYSYGMEKGKRNMRLSEKHLRNVPSLWYEGYTVSEKGLAECRRILKDMEEKAKSSTSQPF